MQALNTRDEIRKESGIECRDCIRRGAMFWHRSRECHTVNTINVTVWHTLDSHINPPFYIRSRAMRANEQTKKTQSKRRTWGSGKNLRSMNTTTPRAVKCATQHTLSSLLIFSHFFVYRATVWCACLVRVAFTFFVIRPFRGSLCVICRRTNNRLQSPWR